jgi:hypothetical protein
MANKGRKDESQANGNGKGTFRFRYMDSNRQFEVNADNVDGENLLEGFRHVANAITGRTIAAPAPKQLKTPSGGAPTEVLDDKDEDTITTTLPFPDEPPADEHEEEEEEEHEVGPGTVKRQRSAPRAPKFLDELNLTTAKVSIEDFIKAKGPDNDLDKYIVIAVWYKQEFKTEEISIDHIFTAYDKLGWRAQLPGPDPSQTLRNLKNNKNWLVKGSKNGMFKVNWNGEDAVNKMDAAKP